MRFSSQYLAFVIINAIILLTSPLYACEEYYAPTAVIDIDSFPAGARDVTIDVGGSLSFEGDRSYDNDEEGESITYYKWYVWETGASIPATPTYNSSHSRYNNRYFVTEGTYFVRLVVVDNGVLNPDTNDEPKQSSVKDVDTGVNTCIITVVNPADCPVINNVKVGNVDQNSADVFGRLVSVGSGGGTCAVDVYWGTTEGGQHPLGWQHNDITSSSQSTGPFSDTLFSESGFEPGTLYYFRYHATNNDGFEDWADIADPNCYRFVTPPGLARHYPLPGVSPESNLIGYWEFEGDATDSAGNNDGIAHNVAWEDGIVGQAGRFSGSGNVYGIPQSSFVEIDGSGSYGTYSISLWFQTEYLWSWNKLFSDGHGSDLNTAGRPELGTGFTGGNLYLATMGGNADSWIISEQKFNDGKWHHVVGTVDTSTDMAQLYADGQLIAQTNTFDTYPLVLDNQYPGQYTYRASANRCEIGSRTMKGKYFTGKIDEVRVYDRVLSQSEIERMAGRNLENIAICPTLRWISGHSEYPVFHDVYFGTNATSVQNADCDSAEYKGRFSVPYFKPGLLEANTTYYWRVDEIVLDPYNDYDERIAQATDIWSFTTGIASPINVHAFAASGKVSLTWSMEDYTDVAEYYLYRSGDGSNFSRVNTGVSITTTGYEDTSVTNDTMYYYRVTAVDDDGNESAWSQEVSAAPGSTLAGVTFVQEGASGTGSAGSPYASIQTAINAALSGDVIVVRDGTYYESDLTFSTKNLTLQSENGPEHCILDCDMSGNGMNLGSNQNQSTVVKGITIKDSVQNGIYCEGSASPQIIGCVFVPIDAGIRCADTSSPTIENCIIKNAGSGIVCLSSRNVIIKGCEISGGFRGLLLCNNTSVVAFNNLIYKNVIGVQVAGETQAELSNNSIINNYSEGIYCVNNTYNPIITNCILWNIGEDLVNCAATYSCVSDGADGAGNISSDPLFVAPEDDDYRLSLFSPCIDAGDNDAWEGISDCNDIDGQPRKMQGWYVDDTGNGQSPLVDMGAHEWKLELNEGEIPYLTSFEKSSGFETSGGTNPYYDCLRMETGDSVDSWIVEEGSVYIRKAQYEPLYQDPNDTNDYLYQYLDVGYNAVIARSFDPNNTADIIRINAIPGPNGRISIMHIDNQVASVQFNPNGFIYLGNGENPPTNTGKNYSNVVGKCQEYISYKKNSFDEWNPRPEFYSYENTWIEFEIHINWVNRTYTLLWKHLYAPGGEVIVTEQPFITNCRGFDKIVLAVDGYNNDDDFLVNRLSVSNEAQAGGVLGEGKDIRIDLPVADMHHPLKGHVPVIGDMWYDKLGKYVIKACPVAEYADPPKTILINPGEPDEEEVEIDPWMTVVESGCTKLNASLGYWMTQTLQNGDYYLKLEVYDDLGRLIADEIKSEQLPYYQGTKTVFTEYPVIGRAKGNTYHYEEIPDVTVNWPGSFPFEFKRTYNHALRKQIYPLFFGWTHNHNIKLTENCSTQWMTNPAGYPLADGNGLGIGKIWLQRGLGCQLYMGQVDPADPTKVIYRPGDQYERDYIVRTTGAIDTTSDPNGLFDVEYVHYNPADGMMLTFAKDDVRLNYVLPAGAGEGVVDWMTSVGIDRQEDRFGNALIYNWQTDPSGQMDMCITEIANNRTPVKMVFENDLKPFGEFGPSLYSTLSLMDGEEDVYPAMEYYVTMNGPDYIYYRCDKVDDYYAPYDPADEDKTSFDYEIDYGTGDFTLYKVNPPYAFKEDKWAYPLIEYKRLTHNKDGSICRIVEILDSLDSGESHQSYKATEKYSYNYSASGDLVTVILYFVNTRYPCYTYEDATSLYRVDRVVSNPKGAVVQSNTISVWFVSPNSAEPWNPYSYTDAYYTSDYPDYPGGYHSLYGYRGVMGGHFKTEYFYEDSRFPLKPTRIVEYYDDDPNKVHHYIPGKPLWPDKVKAIHFCNEEDFIYDRSKTTTYCYDEQSKLSEERKYIDPDRYVLTEHAYHDVYDFKIRETSWQDYCYDDSWGNQIKPAGRKVEKRWTYGLHDGSMCNDPNLNLYLVQEAQLLDETADAWALTGYEYYPIVDNGDGTLDGGQLKIKEVQVDDDPLNSQVDVKTDYYTYDNNGFLSKEWNGTELDINGEPVGNPQKRYLCNDRGLPVLTADYLGEVMMNVYDWVYLGTDEYLGCSRLSQVRTYHDPDAVSVPDAQFVVSRYDDDVRNDPDSSPIADINDNWRTRVIYGDYCFRNDSLFEILPTGATIWKTYHKNKPAITSYDVFPLGSADVQLKSYNHNGNLFFQDRSSVSGRVETYYAYNSLDMLCHQYEYNYLRHYSAGTVDPEKFSNPYIKHTEYGRDASGNNTYQKVWRIQRSFAATDALSDPVLEKCVGYQYDILSRMTAQSTWINPAAIDPNRLVPDRSDPNCMVVRYGYDAVGNRIYIIDPNSNILFTDYDNMNRKTTEYFAVYSDLAVWDGNDLDVESTKAFAQVKTKVDYYLDGKAKQKISYNFDGALLACSQFFYDLRGRVEQVNQLIGEDPDGTADVPVDNEIMLDSVLYDVAVTKYEYSDNGSLERVTGDSGYHLIIEDAEGKRTGIALSHHGKPEIVTYPSGDYEHYQYYDYEPYDQNGHEIPASRFNGLLEQKAVWKDAAKNWMIYEYDKYGKISRITYPDTGGYLEYTYTKRNLGQYGLINTITDYRHSDDRPGDLGSTYTFKHDTWSEALLSYKDADNYLYKYDYNTAYNRKQSVEVTNPSGEVVYSTDYSYDLAGRLADVSDLHTGSLAHFDYDLNGNRSRLTYHLDGTADGPTYGMDYAHNIDNLLTGIDTFDTDPNDAFDDAAYIFAADGANAIDGLGRLRFAAEVITDPTQTPKTMSFEYDYDMMSQLTYSKANNVGGHEYIERTFTYAEDGNIASIVRSVKDSGQGAYDLTTGYEYTGDLMSGTSSGSDDPFVLDSDGNGNITKLATDTTAGTDAVEFNWDNKLRSASKVVDAARTDSIAVKYDPMGNRVYKSSTVDGVTTAHKFIVDISGKLPVILCVLDAADPNLLTSSYVYADAQILAQRQYPDPNDWDVYDEQFYVHDRLGSVRLVVDYNDIDEYVFVANSYTYAPFGNPCDGRRPGGRGAGDVF